MTSFEPQENEEIRTINTEELQEKSYWRSFRSVAGSRDASTSARSIESRCRPYLVRSFIIRKMAMDSSRESAGFLLKAWPSVVRECRATLGSELFYQAIIYHNLRQAGVPLRQIGMNVKMQIDEPVSKLFRELDLKKHENFRGGFEPTPDVALFSSSVSADWRRRNNAITLSSLLLAIEVKASERANGRLRSGEVIRDIEKLAAHRDEAKPRGSDFYPVMMVVDTAPLPKERMTEYGFDLARGSAEELSVGFLYLSPDTEFDSVSGHLKGPHEGRLAALAASA